MSSIDECVAGTLPDNQPAKRRKWTREETIVALDLYYRIPFGKVNAHHPDVVKTAKVLNRPPASLSMKIGNLGRFDKNLAAQGIVGLSHCARMDKTVWDEFAGQRVRVAEEAERILRQLGGC